MTSTSSVAAASGYASIYNLATAAARARSETAAADSTSSTGNDGASSSVSISAAAREAAKNDANKGFQLPDAEYWMRKDFPADIMAEAQARLDERQAAPGVAGGYLPNSVANLPLLPENQALLAQFRQEMREIGHDNTDPEKNARFNRLLNLSLKVQINGWKTPMTEADAQRELDISQAMAALSAGKPEPEPAEQSDSVPDMMAGWKQRWQQEGLEMPSVAPEMGQSLWLQLADKAGIGQDEFMDKARTLAGSVKGNALTQAIEQFISERYVALKAAAGGGATTA